MDYKPELGTANHWTITNFRKLMHESWRNNEEQALIHILDIPEFKPLLKMFNKDIDKRFKLNFLKNSITKEYVQQQYATIGLIQPDSAVFGPKGLTNIDVNEKTEKWILWRECMNNYLKRREKDFDIESALNNMETLYLESLNKESKNK